ncbi:hypothetical protein Syun_022817 [Stephania yunnanensis]|uniref:Uncharacterized protein n=1 Tax=Stephania yunnanensis TaxID=152371 RepID=A0AAP0F7R9_9MAGN
MDIRDNRTDWTRIIEAMTRVRKTEVRVKDLRTGKQGGWGCVNVSDVVRLDIL